MKQEGLIIEGRRYVTTREAAKAAGYTPDYVGQLCRAGKLDCTSVGRSWFVAQESLLMHKKNAEEKQKSLPLLSAEPSLPLLPKEAKKFFLPFLPRQLVADIAGIAAVFLLSLGFIWGFENGAMAAVSKHISKASGALTASVAMELPVMKREAQNATEMLLSFASAPGELALSFYNTLVFDAAAGADILGGTLVRFSYQQLVASGRELAGVTTALMDLHLSLVEQSGPLLFGFSQKILGASQYAFEQAGKGLALVTESLLVGHVLVVDSFGRGIHQGFIFGGDTYLAFINGAGEVFAQVSYGILASYDRGLQATGDALAIQTTEVVIASVATAREGVGSLLALHATLVSKAGEGLALTAQIPLSAFAMLTDHAGELVGSLAHGTLYAYEYFIFRAGEGLALARGALLESYTGIIFALGNTLDTTTEVILSDYTSTLSFVGDYVGERIEPTVTQMATVFGVGLEITSQKAEGYLASLATAFPVLATTQEYGDMYGEGQVRSEKNNFDEFDALFLDAAIAREELSTGLTSLLLSVETLSLKATLSLDSIGVAAAGSVESAVTPVQKIAITFYKSIFSARMALIRSFSGMFAIIPNDSSIREEKSSQGVVVVPSLGVEEDRAAAEQIRRIFSDEVEVQPDASGSAGVISPVFKHRESKDFMYVLVPIKE